MTHELGEKNQVRIAESPWALFTMASLEALKLGWRKISPEVWGDPYGTRARVNSHVLDILDDWITADTKLAFHPPLNSTQQYRSISRSEAAVNLIQGIQHGHIMVAVLVGYQGPQYQVSVVEKPPVLYIPEVAGQLIRVGFPHLKQDEYRIGPIETALVEAARLDDELRQKETRRGLIPPPTDKEMFVTLYHTFPS